MSREKHCSRAEQQNPSGQGPTWSCASIVVAGGITGGSAALQIRTWLKHLSSAAVYLERAKQEKKASNPKPFTIGGSQDVSFVSTRWHPKKRGVSTRVSVLTQRKTTTYSSRAMFPGLLAHCWPRLLWLVCLRTACGGSAAGQHRSPTPSYLMPTFCLPEKCNGGYCFGMA